MKPHLRQTVFLLIILVLFSLSGLKSQVLISNSSGSPNNSAMLEIQSNDKGLLIPRLTSAERTGIPTPAEGLLVYDSDEQSFYIYGKRADKTIGWYNISDHSSIWSKSGSMVYLSQSTDNVGIGTSTPNKKFVIQAENSTDTLMEILDPSGLPLMIITPKLTKFNFIESGKAVSSGFSIGRYSAYKGGKATEDTTLFLVTPDSTRVYSLETSSVSGGFSTLRYDSYKKGPAESYMFMVPENYLVGHQSGKLLQSGVFSGRYNTFFGYQTGLNDKSGSNNVFIGYKTGLNNTDGQYNVLLGNEAGFNITTGSDNVLLGYQAGYSINTAGNNISIGSQAGYLNTNNSDNIFLGRLAGYNHIGDPDHSPGWYSNNIYMGFQAGYGDPAGETGSGNVYIGNSAGYSNTSGINNLIMGYQAGYSNTSGSNNLIMGTNAGTITTSGNNNVLLGNNAGFTNKSGHENVMIGNNAGSDLDDQYNNVFIGADAGKSAVGGDNNIFMGVQAGEKHYTGDNNIFIGNLAGQGVSLGAAMRNVILGTYAGTYLEGGIDNIFIGHKAGEGTVDDHVTGAYNVVIGEQAGNKLTGGAKNVILGNEAGFKTSTGTNNVFLGFESGYNHTSGGSNVCIGSKAGYGNVAGETGNYNIFMGEDAGYSNITGSNNVIMGFNAGRSNTYGLYNVFIGNNAGFSNTGTAPLAEVYGNKNVFLGFNSGYTNTTGFSNVFLGTEAGYTNSDGYYNVFIGFESGKMNSSGMMNTFLGVQSGKNNQTGYGNTFIGEQAGEASATANANVYIGRYSGSDNNGGENTFVGTNTGSFSTTAYKNTFVGVNAGQYHLNGYQNVMIGNDAGQGEWNNANACVANVIIGFEAAMYSKEISSNVIIGNEAMKGISATKFEGDDNTVIGYQSGFTNRTGIGNVFLGHQAGYNETGSNKLYIDNSSTSDPLIYGDFNTDYVQINDNLNIAGQYTFPNIDGSLNQVLVTNGNGVLSWNSVSSLVTGESTTASNGLTMSGNDVRLGGTLTQSTWINASSYTMGVNLNGTGDFYVYDGVGYAFTVRDDGFVGIGTSSPTDKLHISNTSGDITVKIEGGNTYSSSLELYENTSGVNYGFEFEYDGTPDALYLWSRGFSGNEAVRITVEKNGNVGIGTISPSEKMEIAGDIVIGAGSSGYDGSSEHVRIDAQNDSWFMGVRNESTVGASDFFIGQTDLEDGIFHIQNDGDVGIGTYSPGYKLHVVDNTATNDAAAVYGIHAVTEGYGIGVSGIGKYRGVIGSVSTNSTYDVVGIYGSASNSGTGAAYAGYFAGNVNVSGTLSKGGGSFKIDHPLDPKNKYLYHSFVESPDMMNIYNGNIILDEKGETVVTMPDWFEALNMEFRYQLTSIGAPGPNLYIAEEISGNKFKIAGGTPGMKVSWQVTGIRHDPFAEQNRIKVEVDKNDTERGKYLYPKAYDKPVEMGIDYQTDRK